MRFILKTIGYGGGAVGLVKLGMAIEKDRRKHDVK